MKQLHVIVLAAGNSTRLKSRTSKIMHPLCGRPMIDGVLTVARSLRPQKISVVLGNDRETVIAHLRGQKGLVFAHQKERLGTAHAVQVGLKALGKISGPVLILSGDVPLLRSETLRHLLRLGTARPLSLVTAVLPEPFGYGRILRDAVGNIQAIVEEKNATPEEKQINEINAGIYCAEAGFLKTGLSEIRLDPIKKEYYLTDLVAAALRRKIPVHTVAVADSREILGVNTRAELAYAQQVRRQAILARHLEAGVGMQDPSATYIDEEVRIGEDTYVAANVHLLGRTSIGKACRIEPGAILLDARLGDGVQIQAYSHLQDCVVKSGAIVGPFARLRPGTVLEAEAHVGNFVELKKTRLGQKSKANHLAYLGDASIGRGVNVGAGTITCNYDGKNKYRTVLGDGVFVGSDTQLVAPVKVGKGAYIGAGTTVTKNVPPGALALSRLPQKNVLGYKRKMKRGHGKK
ncbi:MAG TPA: UDP-N-acetylglucosamine diphosphorylase/glucosamine-1-phosphate N-acetyltransferase [Deltaproteobacteria bacterium]|nr:UDP-N-acetylglucosamine diphosphorylase/glucosamine-1-phosphate N-acetyltransferase [Deltaproteobacteria bacterium]